MFKLTELLKSKNKKTLSNLGHFIFKAFQLMQNMVYVTEIST